MDRDLQQAIIQGEYGLTISEFNVFRLAAEGKSRKEIALLLGICVDTVGAHLKSIYRKLEVHSLPEAVAKVVKETLGNARSPI